MKYHILNNFNKIPLKIYDGCEPKQILYKVQNDNGRLICKVDLWNNKDITQFTNNELEELRKIMNFNKKNILGDDKEFIIYSISDDRDIPIEFIKCKENGDYIIAYILFEKSPSRYQCYILAVLKELKILP